MVAASTLATTKETYIQEYDMTTLHKQWLLLKVRFWAWLIKLDKERIQTVILNHVRTEDNTKQPMMQVAHVAVVGADDFSVTVDCVGMNADTEKQETYQMVFTWEEVGRMMDKFAEVHKLGRHSLARRNPA